MLGVVNAGRVHEYEQPEPLECFDDRFVLRQVERNAAGGRRDHRAREPEPVDGALEFLGGALRFAESYRRHAGQQTFAVRNRRGNLLVHLPGAFDVDGAARPTQKSRRWTDELLRNAAPAKAFEAALHVVQVGIERTGKAGAVALALQDVAALAVAFGRQPASRAPAKLLQEALVNCVRM